MQQDDKSFGESLRAARREARLSQEQLAAVLGCTRQHISKVEKGGPASFVFRARVGDWMDGLEVPRPAPASEIAKLRETIDAQRAEIAQLERKVDQLRGAHDDLRKMLVDLMTRR